MTTFHQFSHGRYPVFGPPDSIDINYVNTQRSPFFNHRSRCFRGVRCTAIVCISAFESRVCCEAANFLIINPTMLSPSTLLHALSLAALAALPAQAQLANTFQYVGLSGVSAQQMFLGTLHKVYIVDKT